MTIADRPQFEAGIHMHPINNFLARYANTLLANTPQHVIPCPVGLTAVLGQNDLGVDHSTLADGNCCLHAFSISLHASARIYPSLAKTTAFKRLAQHRTPEAQIDHLRYVAQTELAKCRGTIMWDGMTYEQLVVATPRIVYGCCYGIRRNC